MEKVLKHLTDIERKLSKIDKISSKGASSLNMKEMIKLSRKGSSIDSCMKKCVKDYEGITPTDAQAKEILALLEKIASVNENQMKLARDDKPAMDKMHAAGLVKKNIAKGQETSGAFWGVMVQKSPEGEVKERAKSLDEKVKGAVVETLRVYGDATGGEEVDIGGEDDSD
ncbi:hypothetical protein V8E51_003943 [Hyaloscypha variabilis]